MSKNPAKRAARTEYGRYHRMAADGWEIAVEPVELEGQSVERSDGRTPRVERGRYGKLLAEGFTVEVQLPAVPPANTTAERRGGTRRG